MGEPVSVRLGTDGVSIFSVDDVKGQSLITSFLAVGSSSPSRSGTAESLGRFGSLLSCHMPLLCMDVTNDVARSTYFIAAAMLVGAGVFSIVLESTLGGGACALPILLFFGVGSHPFSCCCVHIVYAFSCSCNFASSFLVASCVTSSLLIMLSTCGSSGLFGILCLASSLGSA